ncbi:antibiotic biosynthesis monooxygenase (plasmid) [Sphingobium sp. SJ10-10]|uniref:putative quinol monooxygenase n=1 Tax=Sphingobium sp. SJ10-10 TaxID=3114999 RepID=UPI002E16CE4C|nr:antibiotic biosynthesis monooxygenase [Sphingobium sp. SJ10-10]
MESRIHTTPNLFISRWTIDPAQRERFLAIWDGLWRGHADAIEVMTHFVYYGWSRDPNQFVAIESYRDESVVDEIRKNDAFRDAVRAMLNCSSAPMTMELLSGMEGSRSIFDLYPAGPSTVHPDDARVPVLFL